MPMQECVKKNDFVCVCLISFVGANATAENLDLGSIPRSGKLLLGFAEVAMKPEGVWIRASLMAIGSPDITWNYTLLALSAVRSRTLNSYPNSQLN